MGFFDGLFESEMRGINKRDWSKEDNSNSTLSDEQLTDLQIIRRGKAGKTPKKKSFWDELFGSSQIEEPPKKKGFFDW